MKTIVDSHANKTHFHKKAFALSLVFKARVFGTRISPIRKNEKTKAIKVSSLRAAIGYRMLLLLGSKCHFIAPIVVIGQLTENRCTTTIEEIEHFPVAAKKTIFGIERLSAWRSQNWKQKDALDFKKNLIKILMAEIAELLP